MCMRNHSGHKPAPPSAVDSAEPTGGGSTAASGAGASAAPEDAAYPPPAEVVAYFQRRLPRLGAPTEAGEQLLMTEVIGPRSMNGLFILNATSGLLPLLCVSQKRFSLAQSIQLALSLPAGVLGPTTLPLEFPFRRTKEWIGGRSPSTQGS